MATCAIAGLLSIVTRAWASGVTAAKLEEVVAQKDTKIAQKNEVISELMEENILAKKACGEP